MSLKASPDANVSQLIEMAALTSLARVSLTPNEFLDQDVKPVSLLMVKSLIDSCFNLLGIESFYSLDVRDEITVAVWTEAIFEMSLSRTVVRDKAAGALIRLMTELLDA